MKKVLSLWVFLLVVSAGSAMAQAQSSHYKAAETLLLTMGSPKTIDDNLQQMLTMQMEQVPAMKAAEVEVRSFFSKYMNWDAVKGDLIKLYMDEFTEKELKDMNAFYLTPTGKKLAQKQSIITMKSAQIGQSKVEPHMMELQQAIQKKMQGDN
ncbi:DUF2059 domain-containing protein [Rufibacter glacialis]|uniref:DUF2059 domain-containing protein n=1 Tax=Rufibacter glacialis TaxID=1259555 RepID=A0A5M8QSP0_9BACT|nr:DUF2059 domain-containing protein [Rufibacter glacialis]KAA6437656.1 DUF2059 domain-containing protein [Rufibacter glacialis]GGK57456.1 hypothetical protein GCM10011405_01950 [Rufibacter glacialis]